MERAIGMELGHTNCRVAWVTEDSGPQVLSNSDNERVTPSVVALDRSGQLLFGSSALVLEATHPERAARDAVEKFIAGAPVVLGGQEFASEDLVGRLLAWLKNSAEQRLGGPAGRAWVAVPAGWGKAEHSRLERAVADAGHHIVPLSGIAAAAWGSTFGGASDPEGTALVYDLGGASVAVATVALRADGPPKVRKYVAEMGPGGRVLDQAIAEYVIVMIEREHHLEPSTDPRFMIQLLRRAQEAKHRLGAVRVAEIVMLGMLRTAAGTPLDVDVEIEREQFERMLEEPLGRSMALARQCLERTHIAPEGIRRVLTVGGSIAIPAVRAALARTFGSEKILVCPEPGDCTALGAALYARRGDVPSEDETDTTRPPRPEPEPEQLPPVAIPPGPAPRSGTLFERLERCLLETDSACSSYSASHPDTGDALLLQIFSARDDRSRNAYLSSLLPLNLDHPNVTRILEFGCTADGYYLITESGGPTTLRDLLGAGEDRRPLPAPQALAIIKEVSEGVAALHERSIFHRNLKPANIRVDRESMAAKIANFQISQILRPREFAAHVAGTLPYLSREVLEGRADLRADIYALGVILYEALTAKLPFWSSSQRRLAEQIMTCEPAELRALNPEVPENFNDVVLRALDKNPDRRFQTVREFADALAAEPDTVLRTIVSGTAQKKALPHV